MTTLLLLAMMLAQPQGGTGSDYQEAYEASFRAEYRDKSIKGCVASATGAASAGIDATPLCACVADKLLSTKTVPELSETPAKAELDVLALECIEKHLPELKAGG